MTATFAPASHDVLAGPVVTVSPTLIIGTFLIGQRTSFFMGADIDSWTLTPLTPVSDDTITLIPVTDEVLP